jgi:hypothetical protein
MTGKFRDLRGESPPHSVAPQPDLPRDDAYGVHEHRQAQPLPDGHDEDEAVPRLAACIDCRRGGWASRSQGSRTGPSEMADAGKRGCARFLWVQFDSRCSHRRAARRAGQDRGQHRVGQGGCGTRPRAEPTGANVTLLTSSPPAKQLLMPPKILESPQSIAPGPCARLADARKLLRLRGQILENASWHRLGEAPAGCGCARRQSARKAASAQRTARRIVRDVRHKHARSRS